MKQAKVGSYRLGNEYVDLYLRDGWGADIYFLPEQGRTARIKIGASEGKFKGVVCSLVHELVEFSLDRKSLRYEAPNVFSRDHAQYIFVMRHDEMSDVTAKVGEFLADCIADLRRGFHAWKARAV